MASIRENNGKLFWDFRYKNRRCREYTALDDTSANRMKMEKVLHRIEADIEKGMFDYRQYFPNSKLASAFDESPLGKRSPDPVLVSTNSTLIQGTPLLTPTFASFADQWFGQKSVEWRRTYKVTVRQVLDKHLVPPFGQKEVGSITKDQILDFRSSLAKVPGRNKNVTLSPRRINAVMLVLRQVLDEAADRFKFTTPWTRIKPLKGQKSDVEPFTIDEVQRIISTVRPDFRNYYITRFMTGMRTGELDGLKWKYVDFNKRLIMVRETIVWGEEDYTKTDSSQRDIQMSDMVFQALTDQHTATAHLSKFVFCNMEGLPLDPNNVTKRVWYPLLRHLGLTPRRPYQTRHTAATLWLGSGENPQWIARQLGHSSTEMLFKVYSRFVPNLTRQDGSAFERLSSCAGSVHVGESRRPIT